MSNGNNVVSINRVKNLTRDDVIDHLERCQMAAEVTLPAASMEALLTQLIGCMDNAKPELQQKLTESERYGRQADITIENLERKVAQLAAENAGLKNALEWLYETASSESVSIPDEKYSSVTNAAQVLGETPATDAFLAEVRASAITDALKSLDGVFDTDCVMEANGISYEEAEHRTTGALAVNSALIEFAFQLRQGGAE